MTIVISTSQGEKVFNKDVITVGTNPNCDVILNTGYDILLTLEYRANENKCSIINTFKSDKVLFKGQPIKKVDVSNADSYTHLVITSNKGLAGAYNANVVRKALQTIKEYETQGIKTVIYIVGQKGISTLKRKCKDLNCEISKTYLSIANEPTGEGAKTVSYTHLYREPNL